MPPVFKSVVFVTSLVTTPHAIAFNTTEVSGNVIGFRSCNEASNNATKQVTIGRNNDPSTYSTHWIHVATTSEPLNSGIQGINAQLLSAFISGQEVTLGVESNVTNTGCGKTINSLIRSVEFGTIY